MKREDYLVFDKSRVKNYKLVSPDGITEGQSSVLPLGEGGSGVVYKAQQELHEDYVIDRAIKFFLYRDDIADLTMHRNNGPVSSGDFINEIRNISAFSHENLLRIVDAGIFVSSELEIPYIVTDFVDGPTLRQVLNSSELGSPASDIKNLIVSNPVIVLEILTNLASAIRLLHSRGFYHCDIAPKNIFLKTGAGALIPVLGDLGIAKDTNIGRERIFVAGSKSYVPENVELFLNKEVTIEEFRTLQPGWDLFGLAKTGLELLDLIGATNQAWVVPLRSTLSSVCSGKKYQEISALVERLEFLRPVHRELAAVPELALGVTGMHRKLMPVEPLSTTRRLKKLIEHPAILRLGHVPQLTTARHIFPGAQHTRYEHSLGVLETVRKYLLALLDQDEFLEHLSVEKIETALICALLSNITRFPLSNIVHEIKSRNEQDLGEFSKKNLWEDILSIPNRNGECVREIIKAYFPSVRIECISNIVLGEEDKFDDEDVLIYSFLNCSLDARVVDFVRRDSLHLGIVSSESFNLDQLVPHFAIYQHKLALKVTGVSIAEQIIALRYWLFQRIYWNRPNRAFCSMMRSIILELDDKPGFQNDFREMVIHSDQETILMFLRDYSEKVGCDKALDICERLRLEDQDLYKTIFDISKKERSDCAEICDSLSSMNYDQIGKMEIELSNHLMEELEIGFDQKPCKLIILDMPDEPGANKLGEDFSVVQSDGNALTLLDFSGIVDGINRSFEDQLRRLRVFIHPSYYVKEPDLVRRYEEVVLQFLLDYQYPTNQDTHH